MNRQAYPFTSREEWLQLRLQDITSTDVSALFGLSPYATEFELWHNKKRGVSSSVEENERMTWGNRLQDVIAAGVAEDQGWEAVKFDTYMRLVEKRIGSSFDFKAICPTRGPGLMEIKNVDRLVFKNEWQEEDGVVIAPPHIELQAQHEMFVSGLPWCAIVALVGGNTVKVAIREADPTVHASIERKVAQFWSSIDRDQAPSPVLPNDAQFIVKSLYNKALDGTVANSNPHLDAMLVEYQETQKQLKALEDQRDSLKAKILMEVGECSKIISPLGSLSCGETKSNPGTLVTPEMVGTFINPRKGFRQFRFYPAKVRI
jgi:putative phage-type endonuclease